MKTSETAREISATILQQLGGRHFLVMTGSKNLVYGTDDNHCDFLRMSLHKNASKANRLTIYYDAGMDEYNMVFEKITLPRCNTPPCTAPSEWLARIATVQPMTVIVPARLPDMCPRLKQ